MRIAIDSNRYTDFRRGIAEPTVPTNDLWIAALAVQNNLVLFDRDSDFDRVAATGSGGTAH